MPRSLVLLTLALPTIAFGQQVEFFESKIRPVLVERCYHCHNSVEESQGGLALDYRDGLRNGVEEKLIVPGKPESSRLLAILRHEITGLEMPEDSGKLSAEVMADFEKWIKDGAHDPRDKPPSADALAKATSWEAKLAKRKKWWSLQPIQNPKVPVVVASGRHGSTPIDRFIAAKLKNAELEPAPLAEPNIIVRRTYFALTGLPPTPEEVTRWTKSLATNREAGMANMVDHLLASPHFGERWARHWMDWIRYAESHGSEGDPRIDNAHLYRDYLIRALNSDVPYDQLVREHIAGDLLEKPPITNELGINETVIGPAHWQIVFHGFAPTDALDEKVRFTDDQINTFSKAFLGLTVSCARCHDHKFDAISQADYYALFGILGSTRPARAVIDVESKVNKNRRTLEGMQSDIRRAIADEWLAKAKVGLKQRLLDDNTLWAKADKPTSVMHPWFRLTKQGNKQEFETVWKEIAAQFANERTARKSHNDRQYAHRWRMSIGNDYADWFPKGSGLPQHPHPAGTFVLEPAGENVIANVFPTGVYSNVVSSRHAARLTSPTFELDGEYDMWVRVRGQNGATVRYVVQNYPRNGTVFPVANLNPDWRWQRFSLKYWNGDDVHIEVTTGKDSPLLVKNNQRSWFGMREAVIVKAGEPAPPNNDWSHFDPLMQAASQQPPKNRDDLADLYAQVAANTLAKWKTGGLTDAEAEFLNLCVKQGLVDNRLASLGKTTRELINEYRKLENEIVEPTRVPGLDETIAKNQPLFERGNHRKPAAETPRRFLEAIDPTPYDTKLSGRRELAEDVLRDDNPVSRRVIVNRVWHHLFGHGIVRTPDNFGAMGEKPSHPELLDHLASRFVAEHKWSLKSLVRSIVLSRTWQLSSVPSDDAIQRDPDNRLLSHANVRRLEAEAIRDSMLSVSGLLQRDQFGPSVDGNAPRRSVYVRVIRNSLDPFLRAFDFPEPFSSKGRRDVTNVPAQSLMMMNDGQVTRFANAWVDRTILEAESSGATGTRPDLAAARVDFMFRTAFGRPAASTDITRVTNHMTASKAQLKQQREQLVRLQTQRDQVQIRIAGIIEPVRTRLLTEAKAGKVAPEAKLPKPIHRWEFETDAKDVVGNAHAQLRGGARIQDGALIVRSGGHAVTAPLGHDLREKTLEAWVQLDNLNQRAGGVITVQTPNGVTFDSIVYAERDARRWLAGSNNFARTEPFAAAPAEDIANKKSVHFAITYHKDGRIVGYRNGTPYGKGYKTGELYTFNKQAVVSFGVRHLPAGGNRLLSGRILTAQVYDRALTAAEIEATSKAAPFFISEATVLAQLTDEQRAEVTSLKSQVQSLSSKVSSMGNIPDPTNDKTAWRNLARAMFTFKEFIYVR